MPETGFYNFHGLSQAITKLETQSLNIHESLEIFANVRNEMDTAVGEKAYQISEKFTAIVAKNKGIEMNAQICHILLGKNFPYDISHDLIPYYKFAPLTS